MAKNKRVITRYGLEIPDYNRTPWGIKAAVVLIIIGGLVTGLVFFIRWISDDSIDYGEVTIIESPTATRTPRPTMSPSPTPVPTPRVFMSDVLGDAYRNYSNVAGLLYIEDTSISEILFQCGDNSYYLSHNGSGQTDSSGEVFIDSNYPVHELKESANIVIYGSSDNVKFGELSSYASSRFFKAHNIIVLETIYASYEFEIFTYYEPGDEQSDEDADVGENAGTFEYDRTEFEDKFDFEDYVIACKAKSIHETDYEPYKTDTILTLVSVPTGGGDAVAVVQAYFKNKIVD